MPPAAGVAELNAEFMCRLPQEEFTPLVKDTQGFEYRPERPEAPSFVLQKWGWSGLQPGEQTGWLRSQEQGTAMPRMGSGAGCATQYLQPPP